MSNKELHTILLRLDKDLHGQIKAIANIEHRSVTSQILFMLEQSLKNKDDKNEY